MKAGKKNRGEEHRYLIHFLRFFSALIIIFLFSPETVSGRQREHIVYFEGTDHELNVYKISGENPGKTLMLIGGIQGNEPGGFLSADLYADFSLSKGNLIVVPRANFPSILMRKRQVNEDMNRKFSDERNSNFESDVVGILKKLISESDALLNLHDGSGFYSKKWISPQRNPKRYGQSIIADTDEYIHPGTREIIKLGEMARQVCDRINKKIKNPDYFFQFSNHQTHEKSSRHKEQRKSATYYALYQQHIPAFGIETSKSLPLELKIRHHNLAINEFMNIFNVLPESPGVYVDPPKLEYLIVSINDTEPMVLKNNQILRIRPKDSLLIHHIETNYERGLSADIEKHGTLNDVGNPIIIEKSTPITVRKDFYPCGKIYIALDKTDKKDTANNTKPDSPIPNNLSPNDGIPQWAGFSSPLLFEVKINDKVHIFPKDFHVSVIRGDLITIQNVFAAGKKPTDLEVNVKGFVGNKSNNTGEDRGYEIDTAKDLWKRYSINKKGKLYQTIVSVSDNPVGKLFFEIETPKLKYVILKSADNSLACSSKNGTIKISRGQPVWLADIITNQRKLSGIKVYLTGPLNYLKNLTLNHLIPISENASPPKDKTLYKILVEWNQLFLGEINLEIETQQRSTAAFPFFGKKKWTGNGSIIHKK